jgi:hypothetical protein
LSLAERSAAGGAGAGVGAASRPAPLALGDDGAGPDSASSAP